MDIRPAEDANATALRNEAEAAQCSTEAPVFLAPESSIGHFHLTAALRSELWVQAEAEIVEVTEVEFGTVLEAVAEKHNFGLEPGRLANENEREKFWRALHLKDLALTQGCAMGREAAWQRFMALYQGPIGNAATGMARSAAQGEELTSALYAELCGVSESGSARRSPLDRYSGRGPLMGWLRAILAQRLVDAYRRTQRETALEDTEPVAPEAVAPETQTIAYLRAGVQSALAALGSEERFLLSAYFLDGHTLAEIGRLLGVHEATVSRKLKRATGQVRKELLRALVGRGMSRRAAEEALGTDPRDVDINLRKLLQKPEDQAYSSMEGRI
jgi:RNA polymerase sigma-70 factor (ECF subfamily)